MCGRRAAVFRCVFLLSGVGKVALKNSRFTVVFASLAIIFAAVVQYVGAGIAVKLFPYADAGAIAWGRFTFGAAVLLIFLRPRMTRRQFFSAVFFGIALTSMNVVFYYAVSYVSLGTAVSLEYLGPVVISFLTGRSLRVRCGLAVALVGVFSISWVGVDYTDPGVQKGILLSIFSGLCWAAYMILGRKVAVRGDGPASLAVGMAAGSIFYLPLAVPDFMPIVSDTRLLLLMLAVAVSSSVIPVVAEVTVMRYMSTSVYALLASLYPASSLLVGFLLLHQVPSPGELFGLVAISFAVVLVSLPAGDKSGGGSGRGREKQ